VYQFTGHSFPFSSPSWFWPSDVPWSTLGLFPPIIRHSCFVRVYNKVSSPFKLRPPTLRDVQVNGPIFPFIVYNGLKCYFVSVFHRGFGPWNFSPRPFPCALLFSNSARCKKAMVGLHTRRGRTSPPELPFTSSPLYSACVESDHFPPPPSIETVVCHWIPLLPNLLPFLYRP